MSETIATGPAYIKQITMSESGEENFSRAVAALCADGTVWVWTSNDNKWFQLPPIRKPHQ